MTPAERSKLWLTASHVLRAIARHAGGDEFLLQDLFTISDAGCIVDLRDDKLAAILARAEVTTDRAFGGERRAPCPLCLEGPQSPYAYPNEAGFKYPEGLRRHLTGELGAHLCAVVALAQWVAEVAAQAKQATP
jgi:hypothetical protein